MNFVCGYAGCKVSIIVVRRFHCDDSDNLLVIMVVSSLLHSFLVVTVLLLEKSDPFASLSFTRP